MNLVDVYTKLKALGVSAKNLDGDTELYADICRMAYERAIDYVMDEIGYHREDDVVPRRLEPWAINVAASYVIDDLRVRDPSLLTYVKYISQGTYTRQFALRDPSKSMDAVNNLRKIPDDLIFEYRRL